MGIKSEKLIRAFEYLDDELLDLVEQKRRRKVRVSKVAIAVCICLMIVLPVTAVAANWFGLRDLLIPLVGEDYIGMAGYSNSPEAQALNEWNAFLAEYDIDGAILKEIGNDITDVDGRYGLYGVYLI